jgi:tRNA-specific 2-thiouridylase
MSTKIISPSISAKKKSVFVGLSGGVDSAVSAALLKADGWDVTGVFIRAWQPDWLPCTWREERRDAMRIALALDIPFLFLDAEAEYKQGVVDRMLEEYRKNRTPNPDVLCNKEIKFGAFWKFAKEHGADFIATGHYANIVDGELQESRDKEKDQSYFLWTLTQEDLSHTLFPVGHLEKSEVRELAKKFNVPVAEKKDSQGICFMGDVSMEEFLSHYIEAKPGKVVNAYGEVIGRHEGLIYYTVGERRGFEVSKKGDAAGPFYIVAKEVKKNVLIVSDKEEEIRELSPQKVVIDKTNWITVPEEGTLTARIRYRGEKMPCTLGLQGKKLVVAFAEPVRGLSLGQSVVFYASPSSSLGTNTCLGGAVMDKIIM